MHAGVGGRELLRAPSMHTQTLPRYSPLLPSLLLLPAHLTSLTRYLRPTCQTKAGVGIRELLFFSPMHAHTNSPSLLPSSPVLPPNTPLPLASSHTPTFNRGDGDDGPHSLMVGEAEFPLRHTLRPWVIAQLGLHLQNTTRYIHTLGTPNPTPDHTITITWASLFILLYLL